MRIAYFTDTYHPQINGVTYTIASWKRALEGKGHEVSVVYPDSSYDGCEGEHPVPSVPVQVVEDYRLGLSLPGDLSERVEETDVVHVHGQFSMGILGKRIAARDGSPVIATHHTPISHYLDYVSGHSRIQSVLEQLYRSWERRFYSGVDEILAPSHYTAEELGETIGKDVKPLSNGIDTGFFQPRDTGFLESKGVKGDRTVGFCGRLGYEKNLEDLVELSRGFDGEVVVAGDGFAEEYYLSMFQERENMTYLGRLDREEMPGFYSDLDAFILPSTAETQGVSVLEANACGTPAVGADALALRETIEEGVNGYRYSPGNIEELKEAVLRVLVEDLSASSREMALQHGLESTVSALEEIYRHHQEKMSTDM